MTAIVIAEQQDGEPTETGQALDGLTRVRFSGAVTAATASQVRARLRRIRQQGHTRVLVDLQAVTRIDAVGIAVLLEARRAFQAVAGVTLVLRANRVVCRALRATKTVAAYELAHGSGM